MFDPRFTITPKLLGNVKRIGELVTELNTKRFPKVILVDFEKRALAISAYSSTSIEGNPLPLTEVKKLLKQAPKHIRDSEREVLNYNQALLSLNKLVEQGDTVLNVKRILEIQRIVTDGLMDKLRSGKLRQEPVFVNNPRTRQTVYYPPDHQDVPKLMDELIDYVRYQKNTLDPLMIASIFHRQFVIIHPFVDGNGRTTRLATKLLLAGMGLNTFNLFSFENYYNKNVTKYFQYVGLLGNYYDLKDSVDFTEWLEYFTDGIIDELLHVSKELAQSSLTPKTALQPYHQAILDFIKEYGFIKDSDYAHLTKRARPTRHLDLRKLVDLGLIEKQGKGKGTYYRLKNG